MTISRRPSAAAILAVLATVVLVAGCSSTVTGTAVAQQDTVPATELPNDTLLPPTTTPSGTGGDVSIDAQAGDCVRLGGTVDDATIEEAPCGSPESNYRVVSAETSVDFCPSDVDQTYYETLNGVEQGALCLDIDFVVGGCMDLGTPDPERSDCDASMIEGVRVVEILQGTSDENDCSSDQSYVYDERDFVVCFDPA
ncbi:LppU family putative lipoprotein [Rhodococcus sp. MEB064]|uniref:LppU family putative lipoprotein n=1 Tax=Rhodococcus sp. MEB064 TaxID=1587522 RepID=UPI0005ACDEE1|nr:hypothetical protein [Rhodococcus sp. MEB064]KIQ10938.1 hypothetical protein RU01_19570 [Rhodococcus sp. MEB064]